MGDRESSGRPDGSRRSKPSWTHVLAPVLLIGACLLAALLGAGIMVMWARSRVVGHVMITATRTLLPIRTRTQVPTPESAPTRATAPTLSATPTPTSPSLTRTAAPSRTPAASRTAAPTRTPSPIPRLTATVASGTPTPWVCTDLDQVGQIRLAQGQRFGCTFQEEQFTAKLAEVQDLPCSAVRVTLADGRIALACRVFFEVRISGVVKTDGCRLSVEITQGPAGFVDTVQDWIDQELQRMVGASICIDQVTVGGGEMAIGGYGK
jgi:hypothetical protein